MRLAADCFFFLKFRQDFPDPCAEASRFSPVWAVELEATSVLPAADVSVAASFCSSGGVAFFCGNLVVTMVL